jgi:PIN domain nuclease of toxin-antitoxin system
VSTVLDASAVLAFLLGEAGADVVETALHAGSSCGAANWSEVAQKVLAADRDWSMVRAVLSSYGLDVLPVTTDDAEAAAALWRRGSALSLADRLCLALAERLDAAVLTADTAWGSEGRIRQIR